MERRAIRGSGVFVLGLVLLLGTSPAWSQAVHTGTVTGSVVLPDGTPSPGAAVVLEGPALVSGNWSTVSDDRGNIVFLRVPPGTYKATASLSGFNTAQYEDFVVKPGSTVPLTFNLEIAAATGEIVVTSVAPVVDTRSSSIPTSFDEKMLEAIPTSRESFYDLSLTAPGMASVGAGEGEMPSPSAYGSAADTNMFLVNGVNVTSPRGANFGSLLQVNYDTVQEYRVIALGSQAEYGSFSGAAIDVLTRSGSNEFHGSAGYYTQLGEGDSNATSDFGADWLYAGNAEEELVTLPIDEWEAALTFGGPIVKDALWFYFGFDRRESETDTPGRPLNAFYEGDIFDLKLTGQFGNAHRAWLGVHYEDLLSRNNTWGPFDPSMTYHTPSDNTSIQAEYQWVVSDTNLFGFKYLGFETEQSPYIDEIVGSPGYINWWKWIGQAVGTGGDFPYVEKMDNKRDTLQADFTHYADDWAGQHEIKFGVQYTTAEGNWMGGYFQGSANFAYPYGWWYTRDYMNNAWWSCDYTWCVAPDETIVMYVNNVSRNPWLNVRESDSLGAFIDDQWVISDRVTLNLGLRYDNMTADYGQGAVYERFDISGDVDNPTLIRTTEGFDVYDFKTWSPRLGIAWSLTDDGKTVLRAHLGRYYSPISVESLRRHGPDMGDQTTDQWMYFFTWDEADLNGNDWVDPEDVLWMTQQLAGMEPAYLRSSESEPASWRLEVDPSTTSPYTDQFNISLQRQLGRDASIEFSYIYKKTQDFIILSPYNINTGEFYEFVGRPYTTSAGYETTLWGIEIQDFNGDGVIDNEDANEPCYQCPTTGWRTRNAPDFDGQTPDRVYQGFQVVLNKRFSNRWQGNFALNYTKTDGFYPRIVKQEFYADMPLLYDTPIGSTPNHFNNNLSGPAMMTPEWMVKVAGSYTIPVIETDFGFRLRYDSGRPVWEVDSNLGPWWSDDLEFDPDVHLVQSGWHERMVAVDADDPDWLPSTTIVDLNLRRRFGLGSWGGGITVSFDALNVFNEDTANSVGYSGADYGAVYGLVRPRIYRLGLKFDF